MTITREHPVLGHFSAVAASGALTLTGVDLSCDPPAPKGCLRAGHHDPGHTRLSFLIRRPARRRRRGSSIPQVLLGRAGGTPPP